MWETGTLNAIKAMSNCFQYYGDKLRGANWMESKYHFFDSIQLAALWVSITEISTQFQWSKPMHIHVCINLVTDHLNNCEESNNVDVNLEMNWSLNDIDCRSKEPFRDIGHVLRNNDRNP